jgi:hypothetical protein
MPNLARVCRTMRIRGSPFPGDDVPSIALSRNFVNF